MANGASAAKGARGGAGETESARLVVRLQAGDSAAFEELYVHYFDRVLRYLTVILKDRHEAEDATQEVFTHVLEAVPRYELRGRSFDAWLFTIARNWAIDHLRKHGRVEVEDPGEIDRRREPAAAEDENISKVLGWLSDEDIAFLVGHMPLAQRQALTLRFLFDFDNAEIAQILGTTREAVRQLHHRALEFLNERLTSLGREPKMRSRGAPTRRLYKQAPVLRARRFSLSR